MASSAQNQQHFPTSYGTTTTAPPPTPSTAKPNFSATSTSTSDDVSDLLSRLLHRLPPTLSTTPILRRRGPSPLSTATTTSPPLIPFPDLTSSLSTNLPSISELGFFQIINHSIPSHLANSAESESLSIFNLSRHDKHQHFPRNWPLGFDDDCDDDDEASADGAGGESLFLDSSCSTESSELTLSCLSEFTREMEKVGLAVVEALSCAMGFVNPARQDPARVCAMMWISTGSAPPGENIIGSGKFYPYVVGLHYQIRSQKCSLLTDTGLVSVSPQIDSILVTLGDIAQVWSNGKLKKVKGKPLSSLGEINNSTSLSMSLLLTLPLESTVFPLLPRAVASNGNRDCGNDNQDEEEGENEMGEESKFNSFSFEDYAWRVYHERMHIKDPLDRYRTPTD